MTEPQRDRLSLQENEDAEGLGIILTAPSERGLPSQTGGGAFGRCKNRISNRRAHSPSVTLTRATSLPEGGIIRRGFGHYSSFIIHYSFFNALSVTHLRATSPKGRGLDFAKACAKHLATVGTGVPDGPQTKTPRFWALFILHYSFFIPHKYPHLM